MGYSLALRFANKRCRDIMKDGEVFGGWFTPVKTRVYAFGVGVKPFMKRAYARPISGTNFGRIDRQ